MVGAPATSILIPTATGLLHSTTAICSGTRLLTVCVKMVDLGNSLDFFLDTEHISSKQHPESFLL